MKWIVGIVFALFGLGLITAAIYEIFFAQAKVKSQIRDVVSRVAAVHEDKDYILMLIDQYKLCEEFHPEEAGKLRKKIEVEIEKMPEHWGPFFDCKVPWRSYEMDK